METEKKEKKPYEPPTLTITVLEEKYNLLCSSGDCGDYEDEMGGIPVIIGKRG